ncbi:hypothetical protein C1S82_13015 [Mycolicibacterium cosmeticum]|uniref:Scaffolding protein n=1 Tax=Mycolicibacterium cosmeticum TaxID=258533 RepID=W9AI80_MYCCO|nr:hypothetical protein [Mycolicibacterium cosmeticum]TLH72961.1 hypothetical protein C1S82_13015 [Mycolicibacterium cosmeticum]CDO05439.1 hypothetical protein BN977_00208 [Mycolicibacterium cosmeticum]
MTDNNIDVASVEDPTAEAVNVEPVDVQTDTAGEAEDTATAHDDRETGGNREAAKYRRQLREAEAQRDALAERLGVIQRNEAERVARKHLADPADLWRDGLEMAALLDENGNLDPAKVEEASQAVLAAHRHWGRNVSAQDRMNRALNGRFASGASSDEYTPPVSWASVINKRHRDD